MPEKRIIVNPDKIPDAYIKAEIERVEKEKNRKVKYAAFKMLDNGTCKQTYRFFPVNFERIRRITGYLVGSTEEWNDAKQAEERDRVKHI